MIYLISILIIMYLLFIIYIYLLRIKIDKFEKKIIYIFKEKNNQIPSIYEVTKSYLNKHDEIFNELLSYKKIDISENNFYSNLVEKANTYKNIHNEYDFIFKICNKHPKLEKNYKYLYIKDVIIEKSTELWKKLWIYKKIVSNYNHLIKIKNFTIIWLLIPIHDKEII